MFSFILLWILILHAVQYVIFLWDLVVLITADYHTLDTCTVFCIVLHFAHCSSLCQIMYTYRFVSNSTGRWMNFNTFECTTLTLLTLSTAPTQLFNVVVYSADCTRNHMMVMIEDIDGFMWFYDTIQRYILGSHTPLRFSVIKSN